MALKEVKEMCLNYIYSVYLYNINYLEQEINEYKQNNETK